MVKSSIFAAKNSICAAKALCARQNVIYTAVKVICAARNAICAGQVIYVRLSLYVCGINNIITISLKVCYLCADNKSANGHPYLKVMLCMQYYYSQLLGNNPIASCRSEGRKRFTL